MLNAIYENDFLGFSCGFRPGRSSHLALDALTVGIETKRVNWVFEADIRSFYDTLKHGWLVKFIEHRISDRRVVRIVPQPTSARVFRIGTAEVSWHLFHLQDLDATYSVARGRVTERFFEVWHEAW